jgi:glycosyltransferase involved in cell wall biosynthesis
MEVLVVDGMSTDGTRELIALYAARDRRVRLIENPEQITPSALNRGIQVSNGEIIARIDAHAAIANNYLSLCVRHLLERGADNVGGSMRTLPQDEGPFAEPIVAALSHRFGVGNSYFRIGSGEPRWVDTVFGGCWRRDVFTRVGLFNPDLKRSQDMEFSLRLKAAGGRTLLVPDVWSDYYARARLSAFWRHNFVNGEWAILPFLYSSVNPVSLRHLIPFVFVLSVLGGLGLSPWSALPLLAVLSPYLFLNLLASGQLAWRDRRPSFLTLMPIVFLSLHLGYGLGSVSGVLKAADTLLRSGAARSKENPCIPLH